MSVKDPHHSRGTTQWRGVGMKGWQETALWERLEKGSELPVGLGWGTMWVLW